jgi:hypothetical protein
MQSSKYNLSSSHPLIENSQEYVYDRQIISIHSEDRNILRYPKSSLFEIELPQDYNNVLSITLESWTFPSNYDTFSLAQNNISLAFTLTNIYNPADYPDTTDTSGLLTVIYQALTYYNSINTVYYAIIEEGFYVPNQINIELQNRMNAAVTYYITQYITDNAPSFLTLFTNIGYNQFIVAYNQVGQKLWFGNRSSGFIIKNDDTIYLRSEFSVFRSCENTKLPEDVNWGLPYYLGFTRCPVESDVTKNEEYPRFYYGDYNSGDGGYWILPNENNVNNDGVYYSPTAPIYYLTSNYKINLMGQSYFYLEIDGINTIDETSPFSLCKSTIHTNETLGVVKSSFAKISIPTTPISQWFENTSSKAVKYFNPPAERIRKMNIKLRYHNGQLVDFGTFNFSFSLELVLLRPQQIREYRAVNPYRGQV